MNPPAFLADEWRRLVERYPALALWTFRVNTRMQNRMGLCKYRPQLVEVAAWVIEALPPEVSLNTLRHETAHALLPSSVGHGTLWKLKAVELGAAPLACSDAVSWEQTPAYRKARWHLVCPHCQYNVPRIRNTGHKYIHTTCGKRMVWQAA